MTFRPDHPSKKNFSPADLERLTRADINVRVAFRDDPRQDWSVLAIRGNDVYFVDPTVAINQSGDKDQLRLRIEGGSRLNSEDVGSHDMVGYPVGYRQSLSSATIKKVLRTALDAAQGRDKQAMSGGGRRGQDAAQRTAAEPGRVLSAHARMTDRAERLAGREAQTGEYSADELREQLGGSPRVNPDSERVREARRRAQERRDAQLRAMQDAEDAGQLPGPRRVGDIGVDPMPRRSDAEDTGSHLRRALEQRLQESRGQNPVADEAGQLAGPERIEGAPLESPLPAQQGDRGEQTDDFLTRQQWGPSEADLAATTGDFIARAEEGQRDLNPGKQTHAGHAGDVSRIAGRRLEGADRMGDEKLEDWEAQWRIGMRGNYHEKGYIWNGLTWTDGEGNVVDAAEEAATDKEPVMPSVDLPTAHEDGREYGPNLPETVWDTLDEEDTDPRIERPIAGQQRRPIPEPVSPDAQTELHTARQEKPVVDLTATTEMMPPHGMIGPDDEVLFGDHSTDRTDQEWGAYTSDPATNRDQRVDLSAYPDPAATQVFEAEEQPVSTRPLSEDDLRHERLWNIDELRQLAAEFEAGEGAPSGPADSGPVPMHMDLADMEDPTSQRPPAGLQPLADPRRGQAERQAPVQQPPTPPQPAPGKVKAPKQKRGFFAKGLRSMLGLDD